MSVLQKHDATHRCVTPHRGLFCFYTFQHSVRHTSPPPVLCPHTTAFGASHLTTACFVSTHYIHRCVTPDHGLFCVFTLPHSVRHTSPQPVLCLRITAFGASHFTTSCWVSTHYSHRCVTPHHNLFCVHTL